MNADELSEELAQTYKDTPREPYETKWAYQERCRQVTWERVSKARSTGPAIPQVRNCIYCHKPIKSGGVPLNIGGGLWLHAHQKCYDAAKEKPQPTKPVRVLETKPVSKATATLQDVIRKAVQQVVTNRDIWMDPVDHNGGGLEFCAPGQGDAIYRNESGGGVCYKRRQECDCNLIHKE